MDGKLRRSGAGLYLVAAALWVTAALDAPQAQLPERVGLALEWNGYDPPVAGLREMEQICTEALNGSAALSAPDRRLLYLRRADARNVLGDVAGSAADAREAMKLGDGIDAQVKLARALLQLPSSREEAAAVLASLRKGGPKSASILITLGAHYHASGRKHEALRCFEDAVKLDGSLQSAHNGRAACLLDTGDYREAIVGGRTALGSQPTLGGNRMLQAIYQNRAAAHLRLGRMADAYPDLCMAWRLDPSDAGVSANLWHCAAALGKFGTAFLVAHERAKRHPKDAAARWGYALGMAQLGGPDGPDAAVVEVREAIKLDPENPAASSAAGTIFMMRGDHRMAARAYEQAIDLHLKARGQANVGPVARYAFLLATCPDPEIRNGSRALELAEPVAAALHQRRARRAALAVLAMAQAECAEFAKAVATLEEAAAMFEEDEEGKDDVERILAGFRARRPYRYDPRDPTARFIAPEPCLVLAERF